MKRSSARSAGKPWCRQVQGAITGTIVRIVCPVSIWTTSPETGRQTAAALWSRSLLLRSLGADRRNDTADGQRRRTEVVMQQAESMKKVVKETIHAKGFDISIYTMVF